MGRTEASHTNIVKILSAASLVIVLALINTGCMSFSGDKLTELKPIKPKVTVAIEESVSQSFNFHLDGGGMMTSNKAGRNINDAILDEWKSQNYISNYDYVPLEKFSGKADYNLTLKGSQIGDSSVAMQVISGLTLLIIPHFVDTTYDLEYVLKNVKTGKTYTAKATDSFSMMWWLFYFPACPVSMLGYFNTVDRISEHVYQDFVKQGAFAELAVSVDEKAKSSEGNPNKSTM